MTKSQNKVEQSIPQRVQEKLKYYVYLYVDPRDSKPFYVGKGHGSRALSHLHEVQNAETGQVIADLRKHGYEPEVEILKYGLENEHEALLVESAAIDLVDVAKLTNKVRGHGSAETGRCRLEDLILELNADEADILDAVILININQLFRYGMSDLEMYDATRGIWVLDPQRAEQASYVFSVYAGIVREVYAIAGWFPAGATWTTRKDLQEYSSKSESARWEFVGNIASRKVRQSYIGKSVRNYSLGQNPIRYINVD